MLERNCTVAENFLHPTFTQKPYRMQAPTYKSIQPTEAADALSILADRLGPLLKAVYLHGSAVGRGLRKHSDVDLLAVVEGELPDSIRSDLLTDLKATSGLYPSDHLGRRPLEIIIFQAVDLERLSYPARTEFVYGEWLRDAYTNGEVPQAEFSPEFTLVLAQARREAVPLLGPELTKFVEDIPFQTIRRAIGDLLPELISSAEGDERNVLLTLARMWRTLATNQFVSKDEAADWVGPNLSDQAACILSTARDAYLGERKDDLHLRPKEVSRAIEELQSQIIAVL